MDRFVASLLLAMTALQRDCIKSTRSVIARSACDEAIHAARAMDYRASLVMTATPEARVTFKCR